MAGVILADTSILIDYYRKTDKSKTIWLKLAEEGYNFAISVITKYEISTGVTQQQITFWDSIFSQVQIIDLDEACINHAVTINQQLKKKRKQINIADLFIAATAKAYDLPLATLNFRHFQRVDSIILIEY